MDIRLEPPIEANTIGESIKRVPNVELGESDDTF